MRRATWILLPVLLVLLAIESLMLLGERRFAADVVHDIRSGQAPPTVLVGHVPSVPPDPWITNFRPRISEAELRHQLLWLPRPELQRQLGRPAYQDETLTIYLDLVNDPDTGEIVPLTVIWWEAGYVADVRFGF